MKKTLLSLLALAIVSIVNAQNVNIPDANFKAFLLGESSINTNNDTEIQVAEANNYTGMIQCESLGIMDLTGIEEFTSLSILRCGGNSLTSLDLTSNTNLQGTFRCDNNNITSLILPSGSGITEIYCGNNNIGLIDISVVPNITLFHAVGNNFPSLDVSSNTALVTLNFGNAPLTTIDLTGIVNLDYIACQGSGLTSLDISMCPLVSGMYAPNMVDLTEMNLANGNNMSFAPGSLSATGCTNLSCVTVDNVSFSNSVWQPAFDAGTTFSLDCSQGGTPLATSVSAAGISGATTVEVGSTLQMEATVLPANAVQAVIWQSTNGTGTATIDMNTGVLTGLSVGTVTVGAVAMDGSNEFGTIEITVIAAVGVEELNSTQISLFPNPTNGKISIDSEHTILAVELYDMQGALILNQIETILDIQHLESGIYIVKVMTSIGSTQKRIIKQ